MVCINLWKIYCINKDSFLVENIRVLGVVIVYLWVLGQISGVEFFDVSDGFIQRVVLGFNLIYVGLVFEDIKKRNFI